MPGKSGMRKTVRWDAGTRETILAARQALVNEGWRRPAIRKTLYRLLDLPGWSKNHYDTLCGKLGEWRDAGLIPFGLFSDENAGNDHTPMTSKQLKEALALLRDMSPAQLGKDGYLHGVLVEHSGDVDDISEMLDDGPVVSSQGQLRREHLHTVITKWQEVVNELKGKGIKLIMLVDYDKGGEDIFEAHRKWLKRIFGLDLKKWGITSEQVRAAGLPANEPHQIEGWSGRYGHDRLRRELRRACGLDA